MPIRYPMESLGGMGLGVVLIAGPGAAVAAWAAHAGIDPGRSETTPLGIVSIKVAGTPERAVAILDARGDDWRRRAQAGLRFDGGFLVAYSTALTAACLLSARVLDAPVPPGRLTRRWRGQWVAGGLDAVENVALWRMLGGSREVSWLALARRCALAKFTLVGLGLAYSPAGAPRGPWPEIRCRSDRRMAVTANLAGIRRCAGAGTGIVHRKGHVEKAQDPRWALKAAGKLVLRNHLARTVTDGHGNRDL